MVDLRIDKQNRADGSRLHWVHLDSDRVLDVVVNNLESSGFPSIGHRAEAVLTWPVNLRLALREHIESVERLFSSYQRTGFPAKCELMMHGAHYATPLQIAGSRLADKILAFVANHRVQATDELELLLIACGDLAVEWQFQGGRPVRCSCALTLVVAIPLAKFFRESHADDRVRSQGEISKDIFANTQRPPLDAFFPIQLVNEL